MLSRRITFQRCEKCSHSATPPHTATQMGKVVVAIIRNYLTNLKVNLSSLQDAYKWHKLLYNVILLVKRISSYCFVSQLFFSSFFFSFFLHFIFYFVSFLIASNGHKFFAPFKNFNSKRNVPSTWKRKKNRNGWKKRKHCAKWFCFYCF